MKVFKNIIPKPYQDRIETIMSDVSFKWGLLSDVTYGSDSAMRNKFPNAQGSVGFAHLFADRASQTQSDNLDFILPLLLHFTETNDFDRPNARPRPRQPQPRPQPLARGWLFRPRVHRPNA